MGRVCHITNCGNRLDGKGRELEGHYNGPESGGDMLQARRRGAFKQGFLGGSDAGEWTQRYNRASNKKINMTSSRESTAVTFDWRNRKHIVSKMTYALVYSTVHMW